MKTVSEKSSEPSRPSMATMKDQKMAAFDRKGGRQYKVLTPEYKVTTPECNEIALDIVDIPSGND